MKRFVRITSIIFINVLIMLSLIKVVGNTNAIVNKNEKNAPSNASISCAYYYQDWNATVRTGYVYHTFYVTPGVTVQLLIVNGGPGIINVSAETESQSVVANGMETIYVNPSSSSLDVVVKGSSWSLTPFTISAGQCL